MFSSQLTQRLYSDFVSEFQTSSSLSRSSKSNSPATTIPFVYADSEGIKYLADVADGDIESEGIFAISVAEDGFMEMLAISN